MNPTEIRSGMGLHSPFGRVGLSGPERVKVNELRGEENRFVLLPPVALAPTRPAAG